MLARNRGHHGASRLRRAIDLYAPPPFTRSGLERRFLVLLAEAGIPRPVTASNVAGYELDVYWPDLRFAVELDVFETHGTRRSFEQDRMRDEDLKLAGVELTRVTGRRLEREPDRVSGPSRAPARATAARAGAGRRFQSGRLPSAADGARGGR